MDSVVYSVEIVSFLFLICGLLDFRDFCYRNDDLILMKNKINIYSADFKEPKNLIEKDFQELVKELYRQTSEAMGQTEANYKEQIDYYTMWVHQIKTPIAAIRLMLQDGGSNNTDSLALEEEIFKIEQYVEMVLHYLRIETLSSDLELKEINLDKIIKETVKKYSTIFIHKRLSLMYESTNSIVLSDEKWCTFLIEQILSNALKYTNRGSIKIYIEEEKEDEEKVDKEEKNKEINNRGVIKLVIEDTGIGIPKEDINRIFDKGFTGYNGRWDKKASGIGLYLSDKVAKKIAHKIEIDSEVFKGTTVKIAFPKDQIEIF
jgi:signal transduction histidine kinase